MFQISITFHWNAAARGIILSSEVIHMAAPKAPARCVTVLLPRGTALSVGALVCWLYRRRGAPAWSGAQADVFRGPGGTLLIVREMLCTAYLADYALPFLQKY